MRKIIGVCIVLLAAAGGLTRSAAALGSGAEDSVRSFYAILLTTMKQGQALGQNGRYARLTSVVRQLFDIPAMAQLAVGPAWFKFSADQQRRVAEAFGRYIAATYADQFDSYSGERLQVIGERPYGGQILVETRIVKASGEPVAINYLMDRSGAVWRIANIYLDSAISQLAVFHSQFQSILNTQGIDGLIATLNRKVAQLGGKSAI
jgi:phospholipid transport system substrate-binding protein